MQITYAFREKSNPNWGKILPTGRFSGWYMLYGPLINIYSLNEKKVENSKGGYLLFVDISKDYEIVPVNKL